MDSRKISFIVIYKYRKISHVFPSLTLEEAEYFCKPSCVDPFDSSDEKYDSISDNEELIEDEARFCEADKEKTSKTESVSIPISSFSPSSYTTASSITIIEKQGPLEEEEDNNGRSRRRKSILIVFLIL
jgi:hypothetical protein